MPQAVQDWRSSPAWYGLAALAVLWHFSLAWPLMDALPKYDDLNDVFGFFGQLHRANSLPGQLAAFLYPNNEHLTATNHLLYWLQLQLTATLDFRWLLVCGHLVVLATACVTACCMGRAQRPFWMAVMVLAYLHLHTWQGTFMVMTALSNQSVLLFAIAALLALQHRRVGLGVLLAVLASFSQGNGLLAWPVGLLMLWLDRDLPNRRACLLGWTAAMLLAALTYAWAKHHFADAMPGPEFPLAALLERAQSMPWVPLTSVLVFLGSTVLPDGQTLPALLTTLFCGAAVVVCWQRDPTQQRTLFFVLLFLLGSAITASALRGLVGGTAEVMMASRYRMYSILLVMSTLCLLCARLPGRLGYGPSAFALGLALLFQATGLRHVPVIQAQTEAFQRSYDHWLVDGDFRQAAVHFPINSDYYLFIAHYLSARGWLGSYDLLQLASPGLTVLQPEAEATTAACPPASPPCPFQLRHRGNAIALQLEGKLASQSPWLFCDEGGSALAWHFPAQPSGLTRALVPEARLPAGRYTAHIPLAGGGQCSLAVQRKPRKVDEQMRELFNQ